MDVATGAHRRGVAMVGALTVLALAACGAGDDGRAEVDDPAEVDGRAEVDDPAEVGSELDAYLAVIRGGLDPGAPDPNEVRADELVAACMAEAGFEYYPDPDAGIGMYVRPTEAGTLEFAEEFGYGLTIELEPGATPVYFLDYLPENESQRLNRAYRESLSPEAKVQYGIALHGESPDDPGAAQSPDAMGCQGRAFAQVYPDGSAVPEELREVSDAVNRAWTDTRLDPRVTATIGLWAGCMADAGYPRPAELDSAINLESAGENYFLDDWNRFPAPADMTYPEIQEAYPRELAELRAAEIEIAVADATCREESGYWEAFADVKAEIDQQILDAYQADLEAWAEWAQDQEAGGER